MIAKLLNFLAFQVGWFACVWGAAQGRPLLGPAVVVVLAALHVTLMPHGTPRARETALLVGAAGLGYVLDSILVLAGLLSFPDDAWVGWPSPLWMTLLWPNFATLLHGVLSWMQGRPLLGALLGLGGGPLAYAGGQQLGAVSVAVSPVVALGAVGAVWVVAMPALLAMAERAARPNEAEGEPT
jgi:hypothetical protein